MVSRMDRDEIIYWTIMCIFFVAVLILTLWIIFCE